MLAFLIGVEYMAKNLSGMRFGRLTVMERIKMAKCYGDVYVIVATLHML